MNVDKMREDFRRALEHGDEGLTLSDLENRLASGDALLWHGDNSALVTILYGAPDERYIHVWLSAGDLIDLVSLEPGISAWARARGCKFASITGRRGWSRVFRKLGFQEIDGDLIKRYV